MTAGETSLLDGDLSCEERGPHDGPPVVFLHGLGSVTRFDVRRRLAEIRCPTLIVAGGQDTTVPRASADLLRRRIPDARLVVVPGSGHATPYDRPDLFNQLVLEFVAGL